MMVSDLCHILYTCAKVKVQIVVQAWEMSSSAWNSELQQEGVEHQLPNNYLVSLTPRVFNYGVEVQLPRVSLCIIALMFAHSDAR